MTQFDYLLNAMELAAQHTNPAEHGYAQKRQALYAYVRGLENLLADLAPAPQPASVARKHECPSCDMDDSERGYVEGWNAALDAVAAAATAPQPTVKFGCITRFTSNSVTGTVTSTIVMDHDE
jgi:hypothetical protein